MLLDRKLVKKIQLRRNLSVNGISPDSEIKVILIIKINTAGALQVRKNNNSTEQNSRTELKHVFLTHCTQSYKAMVLAIAVFSLSKQENRHTEMFPFIN